MLICINAAVCLLLLVLNCWLVEDANTCNSVKVLIGLLVSPKSKFFAAGGALGRFYGNHNKANYLTKFGNNFRGNCVYDAAEVNLFDNKQIGCTNTITSTGIYKRR